MKTYSITENLASSRKTAKGSAITMLFWAIISAVVLNVSANERKEPQTGSHEPVRAKVWAIKPEKEKQSLATK